MVSEPLIAPRVSRRTIGLYSIGAIGTMGFSTLPGLVLLYYFTNSLGVVPLVAGLLITAAKVWDVLISPIVGARSDLSMARTGSRRRLLTWGAVLTPVFLVVMFAIPNGVGPAAAGAWEFLAFVAASSGFIIYQVPYVTLPAEITPDYDQRTRLVSGRVVVMMIAVLLFGAGAPALRMLGGTDDRLGYFLMAAISAIVMMIALLTARAAAPRNVLRESSAPSLGATYRLCRTALRDSGSFRALLLAFMLLALAASILLAGSQYVATYVIGSEGAVNVMFAALVIPALIFTPFWQYVSRRAGKERGFVAAGTCFALGALSLCGMLISAGPWIFGAIALCGVGYAGVQSLPTSMLADVISHERPDAAGTFGGIWTAGESLGSSFGASVFAVALAVGGFVASSAGAAAAEPRGAITAIVLGYGLVPALLAGIGLLVFGGYKLRRADIQIAVA